MTRATVLATVFLAVFTFAAPKADAGGYVGVSIGTGGVNLSFGAGSWGLYGASWHDPSWSVDFNVVLDGYGEWVWVSGLGRVWRPWVAADWRPYTHGRWTWDLGRLDLGRLRTLGLGAPPLRPLGPLGLRLGLGAGHPVARRFGDVGLPRDLHRLVPVPSPRLEPRPPRLAFRLPPRLSQRVPPRL
jgi:hypothetical protein